MAIVKTLIVKGVARFLTDAYMSTIRSGIWNGSTIQVGYGGTGVTSAKGDLYTPVFLSSSGITACSAAIPHNTKTFTINGTAYSVFTSYTGSVLPNIIAPSAYGTAGLILATNSSANGFTWVAANNHTHSLYVKLDAGAAEQTIKSSIGSLANGVIELWRAAASGYAMIGFSNGTTKTKLGLLGFSAVNNPIFRNTSNNDYLLAHAGNITNNNTSITWNTETTIATIAGKTIKIKIPANPNTDHYVTQSESTTANYKGIVLGYTSVAGVTDSLTTATTQQVYLTNNLRVQPSTGNIVSNGGASFGNNIIMSDDKGIASSTITDATGYLMLYYSDGNILGAFGDGTTEDIPTIIRSTGNNLYHRRGNANSSTSYLIADAGNVVNDNISVSWNAETTLATIAGIPIKIKIPDNPDRRKAFYGTCTTAAATAAKVVTLSNTDGWVLTAGTIVGVKFTNSNSASSVTLNVNSTGAKSIYYSNAVYTGSSVDVCGTANKVTYYMYDGANWAWLGSGYIINSTYSAISLDEITTGTATTGRLITAKVAKDWLHTKPHTVSGRWIFNDSIELPTGSYIYGANETLGSMLHFDGTRTVIGSVGATSTAATHIRSKTGHATIGTSTTASYTILDTGNVAPSISAGTATNTVKITVGGVDSSDYTIPYATNSSYASESGKLKDIITIGSENNNANKFHKISSYTLTTKFTGKHGVICYYSTKDIYLNTGTHGFLSISTYQLDAIGNESAITFDRSGVTTGVEFYLVETVTSSGTTIDVYAKITAVYRTITFATVTGDIPLDASGDWLDTLPTGTNTYNTRYADTAGQAAIWTTARTLTIGNTGKSVNGSANVSWSLAEIGASATTHTHSVIINGSTKTIAASGGTAVDLGSYLPLSGGTMTGAIKRLYNEASDNPMIALISNNQDVWLWRINSGADATIYTSAKYGYGLKYIGTGTGDGNSLVLYADAQTGTQVAAVTINQAGLITLASGNIVNDNVTVPLNTEKTIATICGVPIKLKVTGTNNVTTSAVVASSASSTTQITAALTNPYYNLIEGSSVARSIQFTSSNINISSTTAGVISFTAKSWTGATSSAAGTAGYMPGAASADRGKYLRGDGAWVDLTTSRSYTSVNAMPEGSEGWYDIFTITDSTIGTCICNIKAYAQTSLTFIVSKGYDESGTLQILQYNTSHNGNFFYVKGVRILSDGKVQALFNKTASPSTNINVTINIFSTTGTLVPNDTLTLETGNPSVIKSLLGTHGAATTDIVGNASTANKWETARTLTIGNTGKNVDGSANVSWSFADIGINRPSEIFNNTKTLAVDSWITIAAVNTLDAGTYAISISSGTLYASGIFTACGGTDVMIDEIVLHVANSTSGQTWRPYARISGNNLEMSSNEATGTERTYTVKILKLI